MEIKGKVHCFFEQSGTEIWKPIKNYEGLYEVSNLGRIKSLSRIIRANTCGKRIIPERILSNSINGSGYCIVVLCKNGKHKSLSVHRIVAETFIENPKKFNEVNHKDENKQNNNVENLEWCNQKYNANYGTGVERCRKKKFKRIVMIDLNTSSILKTFESALQAESITGISRKNISNVCLKIRKSAGGYYWRFANGN